MDIGKYFGESLNQMVKHPAQLVVAGIVAGLLSAVTISILAAPMTVGLAMMFVDARGRRSLETGNVFRYLNRTFPLLLAEFALGILVAIGLVLLVVPGLILAARWYHVLPLMADKEMSLGEAMRKSAEITAKDGTGMTLIFMAVCAIVGGAGAMAGGVGILFTFPLAVGAYGLAYADRRRI
jgi:membrane-anchored glycerophosphoryl diester phosphodiesterase (GDPDase)